MAIELTPAQLGSISPDGITWPELDCFGKPIPDLERVVYTRKWVVADKSFVMIPPLKDSNDLVFTVKTNAGASLKAMKEANG